MTAIEILRAASRSVPNEDYVQFMAAVDAVEGVIEAAIVLNDKAMQRTKLTASVYTSHVMRLRAALANVGGA